MNFLRDILRDLVDRRLWPVAVALVLTAIAVPVFVARSAPQAPPPAPATAAAAPSTAVRLDEGATPRRVRAGSVRNPFVAPRTRTRRAKSRTTGTATATVTATGRIKVTVRAPDLSDLLPSITTTPSSGAGSGSSGSGGATKKPATPSRSDARDVYRVTLRFGRADGTPKTYADLARLTPLPSVTDPFFVFLGVLTDGQSAAFLVSSDATPTGDGTCRPSAASCETIELKAGDTQFFDLADPDGSSAQYQMDLLSIQRTTSESSARTFAAYARHSSAGAELLRDAATRGGEGAAGARAYRYLPSRGVIVRGRRRAAARGAGAVGAATSRLLPGASQPGVPVWAHAER